MRISFLPYLRKKAATAKDGALYIRVSLERKHLYFPCFEYLETKYWNKKKYTVLSNYPNAEGLNDLLFVQVAELRKKVIAHKLAGLPVNFESITRLLRPESEQLAECQFAHLVHEYMQFANVKESRAKQYRTTISLHDREGLPGNIHSLQEKHFTALRQRMVARGAAYNTVLSHFKRYRAVFSWAVDRKLMKGNPVAKIRLGGWQSNTDFLSSQDMQAIALALPNMPDELQPVAKVFLFCCYTGLRFSDAMQLKDENMIDTEGAKALYYRQAKTTKQELLPMLPQAVALWPQITGLSYSNQYFNRCLKEIGKAAGLKTNITAHVARHTFATIALNKGIRLEVVQSLLGHSSIKTTQGYAHLMESTKFSELAKWDT